MSRSKNAPLPFARVCNLFRRGGDNTEEAGEAEPQVHSGEGREEVPTDVPGPGAAHPRDVHRAARAGCFQTRLVNL